MLDDMQRPRHGNGTRCNLHLNYVLHQHALAITARYSETRNAPRHGSGVQVAGRLSKFAFVPKPYDGGMGLG